MFTYLPRISLLFVPFSIALLLGAQVARGGPFNSCAAPAFACCPAGYQKADICNTCLVTGPACNTCVRGWGGCGPWHVCNGACGGPGGTACSIDLNNYDFFPGNQC
jgi:hypothetical protein